METNRGTAFGLVSPPLFPGDRGFQLVSRIWQRVPESLYHSRWWGGGAAISVFETNKAIWTRFIWGPPRSCWFVGRTQPSPAALSAHARRGSAGLCAGCDSLQLLDFYFDLFNSSSSTVSTDVSLCQAWHVRELVMRQLCLCVPLTKVLEPN